MFSRFWRAVLFYVQVFDLTFHIYMIWKFEFSIDMSTCYKGVRYLLQYYDRGRDNGRGRDFDRRRDESPGKVTVPQ